MVRLPVGQAYSVGTLTDDMSTPSKTNSKGVFLLQETHHYHLVFGIDL